MPLTPNNREEHWLQGMVDGSTDLTPNKRREYWYKEIVDAIGGGGGGGVLVVHEDLDTGYLDKTWQEIFNALSAGVPAFLAYAGETSARMIAISTASTVNGYFIFLITDVQNAFAEAETADSYPLDLDF